MTWIKEHNEASKKPNSELLDSLLLLREEASKFGQPLWLNMTNHLIMTHRTDLDIEIYKEDETLAFSTKSVVECGLNQINSLLSKMAEEQVNKAREKEENNKLTRMRTLTKNTLKLVN